MHQLYTFASASRYKKTFLPVRLYKVIIIPGVRET